MLSDLFYAEKYTPDDKVDSAIIYANIDSANKYIIGNGLRQYALSQLAKDLLPVSSKTNLSSRAKYDEAFEKIINKIKNSSKFI